MESDFVSSRRRVIGWYADSRWRCSLCKQYPNDCACGSTPAGVDERIANALALGYKQDGAWWIAPDGKRTSLDGLPSIGAIVTSFENKVLTTPPVSLPSEAKQEPAQLEETQGKNEWDVCPICEMVTLYCRGH